MPLISVILPVYNGEKYLREAVDSVLHQTCADFEFIIVDDCSTDRTAQVIQQYREPRIHLIQNLQNRGVAFSLNRGIQAARGKYIARMDADDVCFKERFQKQVEALEADRELDLLGTQVILMDETLSYPVGHSQYPLTHSEIAWQFFFNNAIAHPTAMGKKETFLHGYDEHSAGTEDYELWTRLVGGVRFGNLAQPYLLYRRHENTITHRQEEDIAWRNIGIIQRYIQKITGLELPEETVRRLGADANKRKLSAEEHRDLANILIQAYLGLKEKRILLEEEEPLVYQCLLDQLLGVFSENTRRGRPSIRDRVKESLPPSIYNALKKVKRILPDSLLKKIY